MVQDIGSPVMKSHPYEGMMCEPEVTLHQLEVIPNLHSSDHGILRGVLEWGTALDMVRFAINIPNLRNKVFDSITEQDIPVLLDRLARLADTTTKKELPKQDVTELKVELKIA